LTRFSCSPSETVHNICRFEEELRQSPKLQSRLSYARAWYAYADEGGPWYFAPSKFVGYSDVDAETYLRDAEEADGRRSEAQLQLYFAPVRLTTAFGEELYTALFAFLAKYGKAPSTKTRINVLRPVRVPASADDAHDVVVKLIVAVARTLPTAHFNELREQLEGLGG
jgi:hypothetical protein